MNIKTVAAVLIVSAVVIVGVGYAFLGGNNGGTAKTVYWLAVAPVDQKAQLQAGNIDGAITWEPYASDALLSQEASIYKWSDEIWPGHPCCVVAVDQDYLEANEELVLRVLKAHIVATDWITDTMQDPDPDPESNYSKLLNMGASFSQRNTSVVASSLEHMVLQYEMTSQFIDGLKTVTEKYIELDLITNQTLHDRGYADVDDFVSKYVNDSYLEEAMDIEPSEEILNPDSPVRLGYLVGDLHQFARVVADNKTIWGTEKSLFETYGVKTTTAEGGPYANGGFEMDAFAAGFVDVGYLGSPPAILKHLNAGTDTLIISQVNSVGSAIFVDPSIVNLDDFDGKTIATPGPSSIQHLMFLDYFKSNGFEVVAK